MKEQVIKILKHVAPRIDFQKETELVSGKLMDSFAILTLVSELEKEFDIEFNPEDLVPENLDSVDKIVIMLERTSRKKP